METMMTYTIERYTAITKELADFLLEVLPKINEMFGNKFDFRNAKYKLMLTKGIFLVVKRDDEIRGIMIGAKTTHPFDTNVTLLQQQLFYVKPDSGRAVYHLFKKFIDIGKTEADHIITMLTSQTNIKPETLENLGFEKLEILYRMEC